MRSPSVNIRPIADHEYDTWDEFVGQGDAGTLYHTSTWRELINSSYGEGAYQLIGAWQSGKLVAGFCGLVRSRLGVLTAVTPLLTPYCGLLFSAEADADTLMQLARYVRKFRYQKLQLSPGAAGQSALTEAGYELTPRCTLALNLQLPEDELWQSFEGNVRRNIRKAEKSGFEITDQWDAGAGYEVFSETFRRQGGRCPVRLKFFQAIAEGALLDSHRRRYVAWQDGKLQAYVIALRWNRSVYYQIAAASEGARASGISSLLIWELLREHRAEGFQHFDFLGGNTPAIAKFKQGFHPTVQHHLMAELNLSRRIRIGRAMRDWITRS